MCSPLLTGGLVGNAASGGGSTLGKLARGGMFGVAGLLGSKGKKKPKPNREDALYGSGG